MGTVGKGWKEEQRIRGDFIDRKPPKKWDKFESATRPIGANKRR